MSSVRKEVTIHGLKLFLDMGVGIGGDKWPAADLVRSWNIHLSIGWEQIKFSNIGERCPKEMAIVLHDCSCLDIPEIFFLHVSFPVLPVYNGRSLEELLWKIILWKEDYRARWSKWWIVMCLQEMHLQTKCVWCLTIIVAQLFISYLYDHTTVPGSGNSMAGLLVDKLYNPSAVVITDMESHMSHINHNIELNAGQ